jgi:hypothetical protein
MLGQSLAAVPDDALDVTDAEAREALPRRSSEIGMALDAQHVGGKPAEDRCLPAVARSDLEHTLRALERERLHHLRDQRGLRRHLAVRYRQRLVDVGEVDQVLGDEGGPRDRA